VIFFYTDAVVVISRRRYRRDRNRQRGAVGLLVPCYLTEKLMREPHGGGYSFPVHDAQTILGSLVEKEPAHYVLELRFNCK